MSYREELNKAMRMIADDSTSLFVGQSVAAGGQAMFATFEGVPMPQRIEFPVAEDLQMGFCTGLALAGYTPVSVYPRMDFMLLAFNQLVNHLDKLPHIAGVSPKVIIRVAVGSREPIDAGPQHTQDHTMALRHMLRTVRMVSLDRTEDIVPMYRAAMRSELSTVLIEHMRRYDET